MESVIQIIEAYRETGRKITPQRHAVMSVLAGNRTHPTAEAVHTAVTATMPTVSLRTVYSVLAELVELGEVVQLDLGTGSARFDPNTGAHHHLVCERCGAVSDVHVDHPDVRPLPTDAGDFRIAGTQIVFRGECARCTSTSVT